MLVTRAPLRITLGGGGSDLHPHTGLCIAAAIDKYVSISVSNPLTGDYVLRYSEIERVLHVGHIQHGLLRACLQAANTGPGIEIASTADVPAGTGLGSSGAFTVAVLRALLPEASRPQLARMACDIDTGQQDQYAAVYGGVNLYDFRAKTIRPIETHIDRYLRLYWTGLRRSPAAPAPVPMDRRELDAEVRALEHSDPDRLAECFRRQWASKLATRPTGFNAAMDAALNGYAGKLVGAGEGGFLLVVSEDFEPVDAHMKHRGLTPMPFRFDHQGVM